MNEASEDKMSFQLDLIQELKIFLILVMIYFQMCQTLIPNDFLKLYRKLTWKNKESREFQKNK